MSTANRFYKLFISLASAMLLWTAGYGQATAFVTIADLPLELANGAKPNVIFTFDDSGSMQRGFMPDSICGDWNSRRAASSVHNTIYFNPSVTYTPGYNPASVPADANYPYYPNANFNNAYEDGYDTSSTQRNLHNDYSAVWEPGGWCVSGHQTLADPGAPNADAAYYYQYNGGDINDDNNFTLVRITNTSTAALKQNFANWFSYYRTRDLLAKTSASHAFSVIPIGSIRLAYQRLNSCASLGSAVTTACPGRYVRIFQDSHPVESIDTTPRSDFFNWLYDTNPTSSTPLRSAAIVAGNYISTTNSFNPFAKRPGPAAAQSFGGGTIPIGITNPEASCRQNYHVIFTDGTWNAPDGTLGGRDVNDDGTAIAAGGLPGCPNCDVPPPATPAYTPGTAGYYIYGDGRNDTLADIAFYYWKTDARNAADDNLTNDVPTLITNTSGTPTEVFWNHKNDPAYWQHLVHFTVGLGVSGNLNSGDETALKNNTQTSFGAGGGTPNTGWPNVYDGNNTIQARARTDDLWHAAINSRGKFFTADNPTQLVQSFQSILSVIQSRAASTAPVTANGGELSTGSRIFQVVYKSGDWFGRLLSFRLDPSNGDFLDKVAGVAQPEWDTSNATSGFGTSQNNSPGSRVIISRDLKAGTPAGIAFIWSAVQTNYATDFNTEPYTAVVDGDGSARVSYLRGASTNEGTLLDYRVRATTRIGDIVNSSPVYVPKGSAFNYPDGLESANHSAFRSSGIVANRAPIVWIGGNDGMLHGFNADFDGTNTKIAASGREVLAYVPGTLLPDVGKLTSKDYKHRWYVDATPTVGDAFGAFPGCATSPCWRTILVGGLGGGGRAVYALDVTDPSTFTQANVANISLWEINNSTTNFSGLYKTYSKPVIARIRAGDGSSNRIWVAIFGNGYNDDSSILPANATAKLYIVDLVTGNWIATIDTGVGGDNGLSTPAVVTDPGTTEQVVDYIFAGDRRGNLWKFDLTDATSTNWQVAYDSNGYGTAGGTPVPIFTATDSGGTAQPITSKPEIGSHPDGKGGFMIYFGTGQFLNSADNSNTTDVHTFYGIWDQNDNTITSTPVTRASLVQQSITSETGPGNSYRTSTSNTINWDIPDNHRGWYMDFNFPSAKGERILSAPILSRGRIIFNTFVPSLQECSPEGESWLMELDARSGKSLNVSPFDVSGDGFACACSADLVGGLVPSGKKRKGRHGTPAIVLDRNRGQEYKYETGSGSSSTSLAPKRVIEYPGTSGSGRGSWKQLK